LSLVCWHMVIFLTAPLMNFILPKFCLTVPGTEGLLSEIMETVKSLVHVGVKHKE